MPWSCDEIPDQKGKTGIITGANSGLGYATARALAHKGAKVVMACRNLTKGNEAAERIRAESPLGGVDVGQLDLGNLASVETFAQRFAESHQTLDLLVANAGVMMPPTRSQTDDGFELQLGTNHLGHFALVGHLLPVLRATPGSRVVGVSSVAHKFGRIEFDDMMWESRRYKRMSSYGQSKLANLLFIYELQRRLERDGADTIAAASHPGWTATNLQRDTAFARMLSPLVAMKPEQGALPTLYAATAPDVRGGDYFGPDGLGEVRGYPTKVESTAASHDQAAASRLWQVSEELTGVRFLDAER